MPFFSQEFRLIAWCMQNMNLSHENERSLKKWPVIETVIGYF
jgi:hypothetical protein